MRSKPFNFTKRYHPVANNDLVETFRKFPLLRTALDHDTSPTDLIHRDHVTTWMLASFIAERYYERTASHVDVIDLISRLDGENTIELRKLLFQET